MAFQKNSEVVRAVLWRHDLERIKATRDLTAWRSIRKRASGSRENRRYLAILDALRPTRREGRTLRELARLAAKREAQALRPPPKAQRPLCGARTRAGGTCKAKVCARPNGQGMAGKCRLHGGLSSGATTEGRAAIAHSNATRVPPTKYSPDICAQVISGIAGGSSIARSCRAAGVSLQTFYNWQEKHPEFAAAVGETWRGKSQGVSIYQAMGVPRGLAKKLERMK